ncbi:sel1 repeat family protein [Dokdonella sp.]|uniref:sel1 repeat family protein n=1 Tax=Dokdonella sp. TaxID=2291710 RepID=UPI003C35E5CD
MGVSTRFMQGIVLAMIFCSTPLLAQEEAEGEDGVEMGSAPSYDSRGNSDRDQGFVGPGDRARPGLLFFNKGVTAFTKAQYQFAIEMYSVSASWAYKPAQYNLAVIYAKGEGVAVDMPRAMAWSVLAAERGDPYYVRVRDTINDELDADQLELANVILEELKPKYADESALRKAKSRWKDVKLEATGSRLGSVGNIKVGMPGNSIGSSQKSDPGARQSAALNTSASEVTGGKQVDGSIAYRQLQETDNPYDPKHMVTTGTATVGPIGPVGDDTSSPDDENASASESGKQ